MEGSTMKLMTNEIKAQLPALYSTEETVLNDKIIQVKFFLMSFTWYAVEAEIREDGDILFFGYVKNDADPMCSEWGYFTLKQLEEVVISGVFKVERDLHFTPKTFAEVKKGW